MKNWPNWEEIFIKYRYPILIILLGLILTAFGVLFYKKDVLAPQTKVEVLNAITVSQTGMDITTEIAGSVVRPGVYKMPSGSRIDDLLILSGGFSGDADRTWTEKYLNRAGVLTDGQKIYIPQSGEISAKTGGVNQTGSGPIEVTGGTPVNPVNINTASLQELDSLPGIGQVYAQNIIEHRPYSTLEELVSKGAIKQSLYEKIKNLVTIY